MPISTFYSSSVIKGKNSYRDMLANNAVYTSPKYISLLSTSGMYIRNCVVDDVGNAYVVGTFSSYPITKFFFLKLFSDGTVAWSKELTPGASNSDSASSICFDYEGNIILGFSTTENALRSATIIKYTPFGNLIWKKRAVDTSNKPGTKIAVDRLNNVYVAGELYEEPSGIGTTSLWVAKYSSAGELQWQKKIAGKQGGNCGIASDYDGNLFVVFTASSNVSGFGVAITKLTSSGTIVSQKFLYDTAGNYSSFMQDISIDKDNNLYVSTDSDIDVDNNGYTDSVGPMLVKYDSNLNLLWHKSIAPALNTTYSRFFKTVTDRDGFSYSSGTYQVGSGQYDAIIVKYDSNGNLQWGRIFKSSSNVSDEAYGINIDRAGNLYLSVTSHSGAEAALVKLPNDGSKTGTYTVGAYSYIYSAISLTEKTFAFTNAAASYAISVASLTDTASALVEVSSSITPTVVTI